MIFRKTALGVEEVRSRSAGLGARERSVLILVNGELASSQLASKLGGDIHAALESLLQHRMIEAVAPPAPKVQPPDPLPEPPPPRLRRTLRWTRSRHARSRSWGRSMDPTPA